MERAWTTGMFKEQQEGKVWLYETGLAADEIGDTKNHGGVEKALFAYPSAHYTYWQTTMPEASMEIGGMGENLVLTGVNEFTAFIGDTYRLGEAIIEVSQPRQPCWKPARRFQVLNLAQQINQSGYIGCYYGDVEAGNVKAGRLVFVDCPLPR